MYISCLCITAVRRARLVYATRPNQQVSRQFLCMLETVAYLQGLPSARFVNTVKARSSDLKVTVVSHANIRQHLNPQSQYQCFQRFSLPSSAQAHGSSLAWFKKGLFRQVRTCNDLCVPSETGRTGCTLFCYSDIGSLKGPSCSPI